MGGVACVVAGVVVWDEDITETIVSVRLERVALTIATS